MKPTNEQVLQWAREAGAKQGFENDSCEEFYKAFAALIRADMKERCAKKCEGEVERISDEAIIGIERRDAGINTCRNLAAAIRAMEDKE